MMWGNGYTMAWGWPMGLLMLVALILLVVWAVLAFTGGTDRGGRGGNAALPSENDRSSARQILDSRFATGELNEAEYRERVKVLQDKVR